MKYSGWAKGWETSQEGTPLDGHSIFSILSLTWEGETKTNFTLRWELCVLSAFSLAAPEISVVCIFLLHSLINSKCPELLKPRAPVQWMLLALVRAFDHGATGRVDPPLHDFPAVAHICFHCESERDAVYSPADARVTEWHSEETHTTLHIHSLFNRGHTSHKGFHIPSAVTWYHVLGPYKKCIWSPSFSLLL